MKIRNIFAILALGAISFAISGCGEKDALEPKQATQESVVFTVNMLSCASGSASVVVAHNGRESNCWYSFLTEDMTSSVEDLISAISSKVTTKDIMVGTFHSFNLTGLTDGKDYRYIAFGINPDGSVYGNPGSARVVTSVEFSLSAGERSGESVSVSVKHEGDESMTWYGFITTNLVTEARYLVADEIKDGISTSELSTGKSKYVVIDGLNPATEYRYIVTGVNASGAFGEPAEIVLSTQKYVSSEKYSVNYIGFFEYEDFGPVPGIEVTAAEDASKYYYYAEAADIAGEYDEFDDYIEHIISEATSALLEDAEYYEAPVSEFLISGSQTIPLLLYNGSYRIFVLSLDDNGKFTGDISWTEADVVEPGSDLKVNPDWHLSYLEEAAAGDPTKYKVYIINESEDASAEKGYYLDFQPKSVIDEAGGLDAYINGYLDTYRMLFQIYQMFGVDPLYYGTDYKSFSADAGEKYVGFIVGFTPLYYLSGDYAYVEFTVGENPVNAPALPVKAARDVKRNEIEQAFLAHKIEARKSARRLLK